MHPHCVCQTRCGPWHTLLYCLQLIRPSGLALTAKPTYLSHVLHSLQTLCPSIVSLRIHRLHQPHHNPVNNVEASHTAAGLHTSCSPRHAVALCAALPVRPRGYNDSKALSADSRDRLFRAINSDGGMGWVSHIMSAQHISSSMLSRWGQAGSRVAMVLGS